MFRDREEAGRLLTQSLESYKGTDAVVLALARGGVVTGFEIAKALELPLDIVTVRKIGHPNHPEYAIGAVDEKGTTLLNEAEAATVDPVWLKEETKRQQVEAARRVRVYRGERHPATIKGKIAIVVDDGIATGLTIRLAVRSVKAQQPQKVIVAVPVAPPEALRVLRGEGVDEIVVLEPPEKFAGAVGSHYVEFEQVTDAEVIKLMEMGI